MVDGPRPRRPGPGPPTAEPTGHNDAGEFEEHRRHLFGVAYRMLGSVVEAEDVVQDAWLRWSAVERSTVDEAQAYLTTIVSRLSLDRLRSARHRREAYVGPWLPEPLPTPHEPATVAPPTADDPETAAELADSLTFAFLTMLDRLGPHERVVVLLHDVFGYRYGEIADMVERTETACRQLASRARRRLRDDRTEPDDGTAHRSSGDARDDHTTLTPSAARVRGREGRALVDGFLAALATGDIATVAAALAPDIVLVSDGGAQVRAARRPVVGARRVARFLVNLAARAPDGVAIEATELNGEPAVYVTIDGAPYLTLGLSLTAGAAVTATGTEAAIDRLWLVRNPDKLAHLAHDRG